MDRSLRLLPPVLLPVLLSALLVGLWWWPNRLRAGDVPMPEAKFESVSFAPYRAWQSPLAGIFPTRAEVNQDMALVARRARGIRTYSALEGDYDPGALAKAHGLKLWQGIWLGSSPKQNAAEMAAGIAIANAHPRTVDRVVVGNEVLLRRDLPVNALIADIEHVKRHVKQPVTYADVWEFWEQFPQVARHVDIVTVHILPYWENHPTSVSGAIAHIRNILARMHRLFPGKKIAIGEAGWPSRGRWRQNAVPSRVNEAVFIRRFIALAKAEHIDYNLIEAFDQVWKYHSEGTVGANWGLWTAARQPKFPLTGPVVEHPRWRWYAAGGVIASLLLFAGTLAANPRLPPRARARLAVLAFALGGALSFAWAFTVPVIYDRYLWICALGNLPGQAVLAALLMRRAAAILSGRPLPAARTGADATRTVQALLRLRLPALRDSLFEDLGFLFVWAAGVMQLLLVFDPRYRDFPLPVFAVPLVVAVARALLADIPRGGGWEEWVAGGALALGAIASAVQEGPLNHQSLIWNVAALLIAAPVLWRVLPIRARLALLFRW